MSVLTTAGPPVYLDGPLPRAPRYTLLDTATVVDEPDEHYLNGAQVRPYPPETGGRWDPCSTGSFREKLAGEDLGDIPLFGAFGVFVPIRCTGMDLQSDTDLQERALAVLAAVESSEVEDELANATALGELQPHLTDENADLLNSGNATPLVEALSLLVNAIADTGREGLIHADPATVLAWYAANALERDGQILRTGTGTPVVSGQGYVGAVPEEDSAGASDQSWAFATGPVEIRRTAPFVTPETLVEAMDRGQNDVDFRAERYYLITWDRVLQAAVLVDRVT